MDASSCPLQAQQRKPVALSFSAQVMPSSTLKNAIPKILLALLLAGLSIAVLLLWPAKRPQPDPKGQFQFPFAQTIQLEIGPKKIKRLQERRDAALAIGILQEDDSSQVKAKLREGDKSFPIKLRLKGDWVDHLQGDKWSYRVTIKDSLAWHRLREFSLQSPERRGYLNEWLFHQALMAEGILTTRYDFVYLSINGHELGTYAVEEHFTKQLIESQQRREGLILKLDERGMWDARRAALADSTFPYLQIPFFEAADALPFGRKGVLKDSLLRLQLEDALRLMLQARKGSHLPSQIFDLRLAAKQYALTDLFAAYHSLIWHNRRYYYNPITQKLEPIVFDAFSGPENDSYLSVPFWGYRLYGQQKDDANYRDQTSVYVFQDPDFVRAYYRELQRVCAPQYLDSLLNHLAPALALREDLLRTEYWRYRFDPSALRENAAHISQVLADSLRAERLICQVLPFAGGQDYQVRILNQNPLPVELWTTAQAKIILEPDCGQAAQVEALFRLRKDEKVYWSLPGSAEGKQLNWQIDQH